MNPTAALPATAFALRLADVRRNLERLQKDLSKFEERLYGTICDLEELAKLSGATPSHAPRELPPQPSDPGLALAERRRLLQLQASAGVISLRIAPLSGGSALVQIDGRSGFQLPPALAALLHVLCADFGSDADMIVGWKTIADLKPELAKRAGRSFSDQAVKELVFRLRKELERHGENPFLVQNRRELGYRFAARRLGDVIGRDLHEFISISKPGASPACDQRTCD